MNNMESHRDLFGDDHFDSAALVSSLEALLLQHSLEIVNSVFVQTDKTMIVVFASAASALKFLNVLLRDKTASDDFFARIIRPSNTSPSGTPWSYSLDPVDLTEGNPNENATGEPTGGKGTYRFDFLVAVQIPAADLSLVLQRLTAAECSNPSEKKSEATG